MKRHSLLAFSLSPHNFVFILAFSFILVTLLIACNRKLPVEAPPLPSSTPTDTPDWTATPTFSVTVTVSGTITVTSTCTLTFTATPTFTASPTSTATPSFTSTATPTFTVTDTHTALPTSTATPTNTPIVIVNTGGYRTWGDGTCAGSCYAYMNPSAPYEYSGDTGDGVYIIDIGGDTLAVRCDMTTDGGGWTMVLLNSNFAGPMDVNWYDTVNTNNIRGSIAGSLDDGFDQWLGVKYWNSIGTTLRVEAGASSTSMVHRATYTFSLDAGSNYAINLSNENIIIHAAGTASPGLYTYHNGRQLSAYDVDHDIYSNNCSQVSGADQPWWYGACWSGSFWGSNHGTYVLKAYWTGSGSSGEYFDYGAFWIR